MLYLIEQLGFIHVLINSGLIVSVMFTIVNTTWKPFQIGLLFERFRFFYRYLVTF